MIYNLITYTNYGVKSEGFNLTKSQVCEMVEHGIYKGYTFIVEPLKGNFHGIVISNNVYSDQNYNMILNIFEELQDIKVEGKEK